MLDFTTLEIIVTSLAVGQAVAISIYLYTKVKNLLTIGSINPHRFELGHLSVCYPNNNYRSNQMQVLLEGGMAREFDPKIRLNICNSLTEVLQETMLRETTDVEIH